MQGAKTNRNHRSQNQTTRPRPEMEPAATAFALCKQSPDSAVMAFLKALCAVAEGAEVTSTGTGTAHAAVPAAALGDPLRRLCVMGGRVGMARSLGSVNAGSAVRFLGGFRGKESRCLRTACITWCNNVAVTHDGNTLLVSDCHQHVLHLFDVITGKRFQTIGAFGAAPLQFSQPHQLCIASDGDVFVAEQDNARIQVLTCRLDFRTFIGASQLNCPQRVCLGAL
jgi:DNA-binding beta-propeller fold protein YncE